MNVVRTIAALTLTAMLCAGAGCKAMLDSVVRESGSARTAAEPAAAPTNPEIARALRQALSQGVESAVATLGRQNGFNANPRVRIELPEHLQKPADVLRQMGQDRYVDEFVTTMNRAAEQAVPEATSIFTDAIRAMTVDDAVGIIRGPDDAATAYFRKTASQRLTGVFRPVVGDATDSVNLTRAYKGMLDRAGPLRAFVGDNATDLDGYITGRAVDALFEYIAEEEERIRREPLARGTELLKTVFGYFEGR